MGDTRLEPRYYNSGSKKPFAKLADRIVTLLRAAKRPLYGADLRRVTGAGRHAFTAATQYLISTGAIVAEGWGGSRTYALPPSKGAR